MRIGRVGVIKDLGRTLPLAKAVVEGLKVLKIPLHRSAARGPPGGRGPGGRGEAGELRRGEQFARPDAIGPFVPKYWHERPAHLPGYRSPRLVAIRAPQKQPARPIGDT